MSSEADDVAVDDGADSRLFSHSAVMAAGTFISKFLGFIRTAALFAILGSTTRQVEMFQVSLTLPSLVYYLVAGGALNSLLVPLIVKATHRDSDQGEAYINRIVTLFSLVLLVSTAITILISPWLLRLMASEWYTPELAAHVESIQFLIYLTLPQIIFYGAYYLASQILNARDSFGPMMWAPILNNIVFLGVLAGYWFAWGHTGDHSTPFTEAQAWTLGLGSTLGIAAQALVLVPFLRRVGYRWRPRFDFRHTGLGSTFHVAKWVFATVLAAQVVGIIVVALASGASTETGEGAGTAMYQAGYMVWMLPHGIITVSITTAMIPTISRFAARGDMGAVARETMRGVKITATLIVPISIGMTVAAGPLAELMFTYGAAEGTAGPMAWTMALFTVQLPLYTACYVVVRTFYALEQTKPLFFVAVLMDIVQVAGGATLVFWAGPTWVAPALAAGMLLSLIPGLIGYYGQLRTLISGVSLAETIRHWVRLALATVPGALAVYFGTDLISGVVPGKLGIFLGLLLSGGIAVALFIGASRLFHLEEVQEIVSMATSRLRRRAPAADEVEPAPSRDDLNDTLAWTQPRRASGTVTVHESSLPERMVQPERAIVRDDDATHEERAPVARVHEGQVLADRYRLDEFLARRGRTVTWRAFDDILGRPVLIHAMAPHDPRGDEVLAAARRGAVATDSRFLRVLDAVDSTDDDIGPWVVCEFVEGRSLEAILTEGPLSAVESGWLTRELAGALTIAHENGLYHERLSPDTVVVSRTGNVRIVGLLIEAALHPQPDDDQDEAALEARDVEDLGRLMYACLVRRWPSEDRYGLARAPEDSHGVLTPRQVRAGVSPALDEIADRILGSPPRGRHGPPLRTARAIEHELAQVLGGIDAAPELESRAHARTPVVAEVPVDDLLPEATEAPVARPPGRGWLLFWTAVVLAVVILGATAIAQRLLSTDPAPSEVPSPTVTLDPSSTPQAPERLEIADARDFDPNGSGREMPDLVPSAIDGDAATAWPTEVYASDNYDAKKPGVGLIIDLGQPSEVSRVSLSLVGEPTSVTIMVPRKGRVDAWPLDSIDSWVEVASQDEAGASPEFALSQTSVTRYVLMWITRMPRLDNGFYQAAISEVEVWR